MTPGSFSQSGTSGDAHSEDLFTVQRRRMVAEQLAAPGRNITNAAVLAAMEAVPRHEFVTKDLQDEAYDDHPIPICHRQTISQPYIVAFMTEKLEPKPTDRILEIGTGSGYHAAVLAYLVQAVYSVEIIESLAVEAVTTLRRLGVNNVFVKAGDGYHGWVEQGPFDAIIVACSPDHIPPPLIAQLKEGGRMIIPVEHDAGQDLILMDKTAGTITKRAVLPVRFVPMTRTPNGKARQ